MNNLHASAIASAGSQNFDTAASPQFSPEGLDLAALRAKLWRGKGKILAIAALIALAAAAYAVVFPPKFVASTRLLIELPQTQRTGSQEAAGATNAQAAASVLESQMQIVASDSVLSQVVTTENLTLDPEFGVKTGLFSMVFGSNPQTKLPPEQRALRLLGSALQVSRVPGSYVLELSVSSRSAAKSARLAKAIATTYVNSEIEAKASLAGKAASSFTRQLDVLRDKLMSAEAQVAKFKADNKLEDEAGRLVSGQQLSQLSAELVAARARAAQARTKYEQIERLQRSGSSLDSLSDAIQSEIITQLRVRLASLRVQQVARESVLHPANPELKQMRDQAESLRRQINVELERIASAAKSEAVRLQTNVLELEQELQKHTGASVKTNKSLVTLRGLERDVQTAKAVYDAMLAKAQKIGAQDSSSSTSVRIVSAASAPSAPTGLPLNAMIVLGLGAGLLLGSAYVLSRPYVPEPEAVWPAPAPMQDATVGPGGGIAQRMEAYSTAAAAAAAAAATPPVPPAPPVPEQPVAPQMPLAPAPPDPESFRAPPPFEEPASHTGPIPTPEPSLPLLATVSGLSDASGLYPFVASEPISFASAAIGQLNRVLGTTRRRGVPQTVMIGASNLVEARSGIAMNLALFAAMGGDRVLLVDAEFTGRMLSTTLAGTAVVGLAEVAAGIVAPADVMIKHPELTVAFVPAVPTRRGPEPVMTEAGLRSGLLNAVSGFDLIIFDGGQVQYNASVPALAAVAHDIILITGHEQSSPTELRTAQDMLGLNQSKVRGTLSVA